MDSGWLLSGKFKKVKIKEDKGSLIIRKDVNCSVTGDQKRSMQWVHKLLASAGVAIGYHFGTLNQCIPPGPTLPLPHLSFALGSKEILGAFSWVFVFP